MLTDNHKGKTMDIKYNARIFVFLIALAGLASVGNGQDGQILVKNFADEKGNISAQSVSEQLLQKQISLHVEDLPLKKVLQEIEQKSGAHIVYTQELLESIPNVSLKAEKQSLEEVINQLFKHVRLDYWATGRYIIIQERRLPKVQETVSGQVSDASTGEPLPGVNVVVKGTTTGTSTDREGNYELTVPSLQDTLVFSFVGYQTQEVPINGRTEIDVALWPQPIAGDEVVVVGYGTQKKVNLTGSVSQIDSEGIETRAVNSITHALQGLAPNLNVDINSTGGEADATRDINIRGVGSLSSSNPYILIDGVRADEDELAALNPEAIQNISVLKDAASTAIYGAHAAYGVILVETKKGAKNQDFTLNYSNNYRLKKRIFVPPAVNSIKYAEVVNEASQNVDGGIIIDEEQMALIRAFVEGDLEYGTAPNPDSPNQWLGIEGGTGFGWFSGFANTDWWDVVYKDLAFTQKHNIAVGGGSDNISYHISGGYLNDAGQLAFGDENENYTLYNLNSNITADVTDWLRMSNNTRFNQENNTFPATLEGGGRGRLYHDVMRFSPLAPYKTPPIEDDQGNIIVPEQLALIPAFLENNGFNAYNIDNFVSTLKAEAQVTQDLVINGDFTFKKRNYDRTMNFKKWSILGPTGTPSLTYQTNNNRIQKDVRKTEYISFNVYSNYNKTFLNKHNFEVLVGYQQEENNFFRVNVARENVVADDLNSMDVAVGNLRGPNNPMSTWATLGAFGRFTYNFDEKYLFEFNGRYDGSSRFAEGNRFGFFPSMSVGYNIHRENFWNPLSDIINTIKVRASWGKLGNQEVAGYLHFSSIPIRNRVAWIIDGERRLYSESPSIVSPSVTWETSSTMNIGADITFFDRRLSTTVDVYERQTDNMFGPSGALPSVLGASPPETNSASLKTTGWELTVGWQDQINDFGYNMKFMLSDNKTIITEYNNPDKVISSFYEGQVLGEIWGYEADGLFQSQDEVDEYTSQIDLTHVGTDWQPGDVRYMDLNGDGRVDIGDNTVDNPGDRKIIGNSMPRYRISFQAGASWKNFDFHMLWQGIAKRDYWPHRYATLFWGWNSIGHSRVTEAVLDFWSEDNPNGYLPRPMSGGFRKNRRPSTRYLQDASYIRLKSLNIGYNLPPSLIQKLNIKNMRIYVNGENLLTLTNMWENFDPELVTVKDRGQNFDPGAVNVRGSRIGQGRAYPLAQVYGIGVDISF